MIVVYEFIPQVISRFVEADYDDSFREPPSKNNASWSLHRLNAWVSLAHLLQALVVLILIFVHFDKLPTNVPYVSHSLELRYTHYALWLHGSDEECADARGGQILKSMPDIMPHRYYDFGNVSLVQYQKPGAKLSPPWMMFAFFVLSFLFQRWNGRRMEEDPERPRLCTYLEYSVSSSLMIMVMAMNTGIYEVYTLTSFFALFFGMNIMGVCAELLCYCAEHAPHIHHVGAHTWLWPHFAGWVLFLFAWVPCIISFVKVHQCSNRHAPWFVVLMVVLESLCFFAFGFVQMWTLFARSGTLTSAERARVLYYFDAWTIGLSLVAKTLLAWLLLAPMLAVDV